MDIFKKQKMKEIKEILKTLEELCEDHLEDGGDLSAVDLVDSALEVYRTYAEDESASEVEKILSKQDK